MVNIYLNHDIDCYQRRSLIFEGNLLQYGANHSTRKLADHAISMMIKELAPHEPEKAQFSLPVKSFIERVGALKSGFTNDLITKTLVRDILVSFGCDLEETYFDVPRLRVVPHGDYLSSGVSYAYKAHRDIWYSSPRAQLNWWMPVYAVTAQRAMSFFPEYWDKPVANSSSEFDYEQWCNVGRQMASSQVKTDTRQHPLPLSPIDCNSELRLAGTKGDVTIFSAAHLHATAPNISGETRFSIDFRTINKSDIQNKRGGPVIDSLSRGTTLGDFLRASDFTRLEFEAL
jgi:hypothetical protein